MKYLEFSEITKTVLLKNGMVWNHKKKDFEKTDIIIKRGKITEIGKIDEKDFSGKVYDIEGKNVLPGLYDMHVHLREPGREDKETIETCMPNTEPVCDHKGIIKYIKEKAELLPVEVYPVCAVSKGLKGEEMAEIGDMLDGGAVAISDDGYPVYNAELMRRALEYTKMYDIPIIAHEEDKSLSAEGVMNEGFYSTKLGLPGLPDIAEDIMIQRDIEILNFTGGKLHIAHLSTKGGKNLIAKAKEKKLNITAEVTPHHLILTEKEIEKYDPNFKMKPPLRSEKDTEELRKGLIDGTIDTIATDHAPHTYDEKEEEFDRAPFGIIGLETAFSIVLKEFYFKKLLKMEQIIEKMVINPRKILNIPIPEINKNKIAELIIVDLNREWIVDKDNFYSKSQNSPFIGMNLKGKVVGAVNKNKIWTDF